MSILSDIESGESRKIEFKECMPENSKISKTVVAFSNGAGGKLIIGINNTCKKAGLEEPEFLESGMYFNVIIKKKSANSEDKSRDYIHESGNNLYEDIDKTEKSSHKLIIENKEIKLNSNESKIVDYLNQNEKITNKELRDIAEISSSGARKAFSSLLKKGAIIPIGHKKSRYYVLSKEYYS